MRVPKVYAAINAVTAALATTGIPKRRSNGPEGYSYRGIDDLYQHLAPLLAEHKLCILPRVIERSAVERMAKHGELLVNVTIRTAFDFVSAEDGSTHVIEAYGEALDAGDKATAKAMASAYKYALFQSLCIPTGEQDADASTHTLAREQRVSEPVQGWEQWVADIEEVLRVCETSEAIDRVQSSHRSQLHAVQRERPELYTRLGAAIRGRRSTMGRRATAEVAADIGKVATSARPRKPRIAHKLAAGEVPKNRRIGKAGASKAPRGVPDPVMVNGTGAKVASTTGISPDA